ncbi:hypothetical protein Mapa_006791 [Marchantia paleacea]|nr:hypothetical protein Mapa_006791 [Marchantia paleacea]
MRYSSYSDPKVLGCCSFHQEERWLSIISNYWIQLHTRKVISMVRSSGAMLDQFFLNRMAIVR